MRQYLTSSRRYVTLLLIFVSLSASAQSLISADSVSLFPDNRMRLVGRPAKGFLYLQSKSGGTVTNTKLWLNGVKSINGNAPDALGNVALPSGATKVSDLTNDLNFLNATSANSLYPQLTGSYANPTWLTSVASSKLTGTLAATNFPALTGDVTSAGGSYGTTIGTNVVGNTKLSQMPALTFKGNNTGSTANALDLTVSQAKSALALDQVNNTADADKPLSTAQSAALATKSSAKRLTLTSSVNGTALTHNLGTTVITVLFRPTGSAQYDFNFSWTVTDANTIALVTPFQADGSRETFTGDVFIETAN